ncbi:hypothetical protein BsWGS_17087 [Bradybaena similaris]
MISLLSIVIVSAAGTVNANLSSHSIPYTSARSGQYIHTRSHTRKLMVPTQAIYICFGFYADRISHYDCAVLSNNLKAAVIAATPILIKKNYNNTTDQEGEK